MDVPTPETLKFLQTVLEETWESLRPEERARTSKTQVAAHILQVAATGERDPVRLRAEARSRGAHFESYSNHMSVTLRTLPCAKRYPLSPS